MMATYRSTLPQVFPFQISVTLDNLPGVVTMLSTPRTGAPNGSSFAVTSDARQGFRHVWLSEASMTALSEYLYTRESRPEVTEVITEAITDADVT
jgi:hypothetical protein